MLIGDYVFIAATIILGTVMALTIFVVIPVMLGILVHMTIGIARRARVVGLKQALNE